MALENIKGLLLLINPQKGVFVEGELADPDVGKLYVPRIVGLLKMATEAGWSVAPSLRMHNETDDIVQSLTPHLLRGTDEPRMIDDLRPGLKALEGSDRLHIFESGQFDHTIDGCEKATDRTLCNFLLNGGFEQIHVAGAWSSIDVLYTVMGLRARCQAKIKVVVWSDAVMGYDEESHAFALRQMSTVLGAQLCEEKAPL